MAGRFDQEYQKLKERTHRWVVERLDEEGIEVGKATRDALAEFTRNHVGQYISHNRVPLSTQDLNQLVRDILDEVTGFGPLEPLLSDTSRRYPGERPGACVRGSGRCPAAGQYPVHQR